LLSRGNAHNDVIFAQNKGFFMLNWLRIVKKLECHQWKVSLFTDTRIWLRVFAEVIVTVKAHNLDGVLSVVIKLNVLISFLY
jgi:hypothetical protein